MLELLHPLNAQRLWRGGTGAKGTAPTSLQRCRTWDALSAPLATSKTPQQWRPWGLANRVSLGWAVTAGSACPGLTPHGRASCIMTFSHILIQLMEWLEMLMGLELSRVMKYSGFSLVPIPAAHQRGMAALDLRAIRALRWGGVFPPRHGSNPNTSHSLQPDLVLTFFLTMPNALCVLSHFGTSLRVTQEHWGTGGGLASLPMRGLAGQWCCGHFISLHWSDDN